MTYLNYRPNFGRFSSQLFLASLFAFLSVSFLPMASKSALGQDAKSEKHTEKSEHEHSGDEHAQDDKSELYQKLSKYLTNTRWEGQFTVTGMDRPPKTEYYEITHAEKAEEGDYWNLIARIKYGKHDLTLPLPPLEIKWAGKTPIITVDQMTIPGMGTFDARVVIRRDKYAGTWAHDSVGGHLFGTIKKIEDSKKESKKDVKEDAKEDAAKEKKKKD